MLCSLIGNEIPMGKYLANLLESRRYSKLKMLVAFAKKSGISRLFPNFMKFRNYGGNIEAVIGVDNHVTTFQAIQQLKNLSDNNLYINHNMGISIFHPKVFIFEKDNYPNAIIIGSSNLTLGGLYTNFEVNVLLKPYNLKEDIEFIKEITSFYNLVLNDDNTKKASSELISQLFSQGVIIDETRTKKFDNLNQKIINIPFKKSYRFEPPKIDVDLERVQENLPSKFAVILSNFDVSSRSLDPVILIPLKALREFPVFWGWPTSFTLSRGNYPEQYTAAKVFLPNSSTKTVIRLYYYENKKEFRLQCEPIKRNGKAGDIMIMNKTENKDYNYEIFLIPSHSNNYNEAKQMCKIGVSKNKYFGYSNI